jgi:hypothetical protein|tara:strand:+ start:428 stop:1291 length:864 start_codon:yes stop_codon:yes gene_type:complete
MQLPNNTDLPFFTYGIFKPGQLGYLAIKHLVNASLKSSAPGYLKVRDGLPLFVKGNYDFGGIHGYLISANKKNIKTLYQKVSDYEPHNQYVWGKIDTTDSNDSKTKANILLGKTPERGSESLMENYWDSKEHDGIFTDGFHVVKEILDNNRNSDFKSLYYLQMGYLFLWTIIDRYATMRYTLSRDTKKRYKAFYKDPIFVKALINVLEGKDIYHREIYSAGKPKDKYHLTINDPKKSFLYYYQIRNNITHRGKAQDQDYEKISSSIEELLTIMKEVVNSAFSESALS